MSNVLQILRSSTAAARPTGRQPGELFVNFTDGVMGYIDAGGNAVDLPYVPKSGGEMTGQLSLNTRFCERAGFEA